MDRIVEQNINPELSDLSDTVTRPLDSWTFTPPVKYTKIELDELYNKSIDHEKPFERVLYLLGWAKQELERVIESDKP